GFDALEKKRPRGSGHAGHSGQTGDVIRETVTPGTLTPAKAMRNRRSLIVAAVFALTGLSAHSQTTKDPGTRSPDIAVRAPKHASDSLHHQDTTRVHYTYTGAGTINRIRFHRQKDRDRRA